MKPETKINLHSLAKNIATHLGGEWSYHSKNDPHDHYATIAANDAQINLYKNPSSDKIEISATHTNLEAFNRVVGNKIPKPSIGVSATKSADKIAADINRRLLPDLAPLLTACRAQIAQDNAHADTTAQTAERIAAAIGGEVDRGPHTKPDRHNAEISLYRSKTLPEFTTSIRVCGESVVIERLYLTADETIAVFQALISARQQ